MVKHKLKEWNVNAFSSIDNNISKLENQIHEIDMLANDHMLETHEINKRKDR